MSWQERRTPPPPASGPTMPQLALPPLTLWTRRLLIANGVAFLGWLLIFFFAEETLYRTLLPELALKPSLWIERFPFVPLWQLLTHGFLHDPQGLGHIVGNMLMLYFFGTMLEEIVGPRRFVVTYAAAQLAGALLALVPAALAGSAITIVGASGAVYGVMIAVATMRPRQTVFLLFIPITMKVLAIGILALTLFGLLMEVKTGPSGVAHLAHLGGILYGFAAVRLGWVWRDPLAVLEARRAIAREERRIDESAEMDRLLAKIHREGMSSLTRRERSFLKRTSSRRP
jgi:membrane associated rhomboid family serine protease